MLRSEFRVGKRRNNLLFYRFTLHAKLEYFVTAIKFFRIFLEVKQTRQITLSARPSAMTARGAPFGARSTCNFLSLLNILTRFELNKLRRGRGSPVVKKGNPSYAAVSLSDIRIPLLWRPKDHMEVTLA